MSTNNDKSFFQTLPGVLTATATLITAIVGLITVLNQIGLIGEKEKPKVEKVVVDDSKKEDAKNNTSNVTNVAELEKMVKKILKEEKAASGQSQAELEKTVSKIVSQVKEQEKKSEQKIQKVDVKTITEGFLKNFKKNEENDYDEPDEPIFDNNGGGGGGVIITSSPVRIGGRWNDYNTGASYIFSQNGNTVSFQEHSLNTFGQEIISAEGTGSISGRNIQINYVTMFGTNGVANMTVAPDNTSISCTFRDNASGVTMNMNLMR